MNTLRKQVKKMKGKQKWRIYTVETFPHLRIQIERRDGSIQWFHIEKDYKKEIGSIWNWEWRHAMTMPQKFIGR